MSATRKDVHLLMPTPAVAEIMDCAASKGVDVSEDCARDFLAAAVSIDRATTAVDRAVVSALSKVRRGEKI
jgi:isochorismate synthase EntC